MLLFAMSACVGGSCVKQDHHASPDGMRRGCKNPWTQGETYALARLILPGDGRRLCRIYPL
jgi:hypothetical protein